MNRPAAPADFKPEGGNCPEPSSAIRGIAPAKHKPDLPRNRLAELLRFEGELRHARCRDQLGVTITTGLNAALLPTLQRALLFESGRNGSLRLIHASHVSRPERDAPDMHRVELATRAHAHSLSKVEVLSREEFLRCPPDIEAAPSGGKASVAPFIALLPLRDHRESTRNMKGQDHAVGVLLLEFENAPRSDDPVLHRVAEAAGHALSLFSKNPGPFGAVRISRLAAAGLVLLAIVGLIPIPLSALAPAEIVAADPFIVAAPLDGIIADIPVASNSAVSKGDLLFKIDDTELAGRETIAREALAVATARERRIRQAAFSDPAARRELAETEAARRVAEAEFRQAERRLARTEVRATRGGVALFEQPDQWIGQPVATGERIMQIADPGAVELRVELPVADAVLLANRLPFRLFLEGRPFDQIDGRITGAGYRAEVTADHRLVYVLTGRLNDTDGLRIGMRGTAQIVGDKVALGYYLFRRPMAALRQRFGF